LKRKLQLGPWFRTPLKMLAAAKVLRGTPFDVFGYSPHRREERSLIDWYRGLVGQVLDGKTAPAILTLPENIRGYEAIKEASIEQARRAVTAEAVAVAAPSAAGESVPVEAGHQDL